jgi:hypothetical protein
MSDRDRDPQPDPAEVRGFLGHLAAEGITPENVRKAVRAMAQANNVSEEEAVRLLVRMAINLVRVEWN